MESTSSPHCIPSPPIFSLDVRNLGHMCFEELPAPVESAPTTTEGKAATCEDISSQKQEPSTFLPIEQSTANPCPQDYNKSINSGNLFSSGDGEEDIFDEIFTTFEDILDVEGDKSLFHDEDSFLNVGGSQKVEKEILSMSVDSGSGINTVDRSDNVSTYGSDAHAIRNPQAYEYESSGSSSISMSSTGSVSEPGNETMKSCSESLNEYHNPDTSGSMDTFIKKFGKMKQKPPAKPAPSAVKKRGGYTPITGGDSREKLLARAMAMAQQSSMQTQQQKKEQQQQQASDSQDKSACSQPPCTGPAGLTVLSSEPTGVTAADTTKIGGENTANLTPSSVESANVEKPSLQMSDIPIASRALPILPTSLESFRSQLSKSKKHNQSKKKTQQQPIKSSSSSSNSGDSLVVGATGDNRKTEAPAALPSKKNSLSKTDMRSSAPGSTEYDLSDYFSSDEISGLLSVICSDDEDVDTLPTGSTSAPSSHSLPRPPPHSDHVLFSPRVSNVAVFSFGSHTTGSSSARPITGADTAPTVVDSIAPSSSITKKRKGGSLTPLPGKKRAAASPVGQHTASAPSRAQSAPQASPSPLLSSHLNSDNSKRIENATRIMADKLEFARRTAYAQQHMGVARGRDGVVMSAELQRKIAEDSEKVLKMQTDQILFDSQQREKQQRLQQQQQLLQGGAALGAGVDSVSAGSLPSLLAALSSVGPDCNRLQGLAGLSSVLQGGSSSTPSLSTMYASGAHGSSIPLSRELQGQQLHQPHSLQPYQQPHYPQQQQHQHQQQQQFYHNGPPH